MFFSVMELMTGKAHIIEADSLSKASKYYNRDKYIIVPTEGKLDVRSNRVNGSIRESIDPVETLKPAPIREVVIPTIWDGSQVLVIKEEF